MEEIKIQLIKSTIGTSKKQRLTVKALGLRKINSVVKHKRNSAIMGMIERVNHLIRVIES